LCVKDSIFLIHAFAASFASVQRHLRKLAGEKTREARAIILTAREEAHVDYGDGPMGRVREREVAARVCSS
jgi:hypothetical protein